MTTSTGRSRAAVVTGAAGGLGLAVVELLLLDGIDVSMVDIDGAKLAEVAAPMGNSVHQITADLSSTDDCRRVVLEALEKWGNVDVLVNCAAILQRVDLFELDEDTFARVINTNLRSVFWLCRGFLPGMQQRGWGRIVNVTSVGIHTGGYSVSSAVYESTKAGIHNFTKTLARSFASEGVLVNSVAPGMMMTRMILEQTPADVVEAVARDIPLGRGAEPREVAEVVAFLASQRNTYVSGASYDVNGGAIMS
jgi:acetoacetyl-CoA reductase